MQQDPTDEITRERWRRAFELCETCAALPAAQRASHLQTACQGDALLLRCVQQMLSAQTVAETDGFLEAPAWSYTPPATDARAALGQSAGAYRITQFLDRGGMGEVYLARRADGMFDRQAAVKLIRADLNAKDYRRFRREVQILADLKHANLVTLYDAGRLRDGRPYLVMEYVEGENLRDWLQTQGTPPRETIGEIMRQCCAGLHAAHQASVIHRDIKPNNIIVQQQAELLAVKLLDFGIAYRRELWQTNQTQTDGAIGTVGYMSPEQLQGTPPEQLTAASDVYSIGLVCYEMLAGQPAYAGHSQAEVIAKRFYQPLPPPSARRPELGFSPTLDRVVLKALANAPKDRYQSALAFARELTEALRETAPLTDSQPVPPARAPVPVAASVATSVSTPTPTPAPLPRPRRWAWLAVALSLTAVLGAGLYLLWQRLPARTTTPLTTLPPPPGAPDTPGLQLRLTVRNAQGRPLPQCSFALFNAGVSSEPKPITTQNALVLRTDATGHAESAAVRPGTYLTKTVCRSHRTLSETLTLAEDLARPGTISVVRALQPE
ncbi:MAG: serine/threonine protein kinase [Acidobacteria bacterium]|nr:serine/threonine protein kinase [Acidobacteriota bacterium]